MRALIGSLLLAGMAVAAIPASRGGAQTSPGDDPVSFPSGDRDAGQHSSLLLLFGISPRAVALGEAMGAVEGDPTSLWYNAAGIARIRSNSFMVTASQRFANTQLAGAVVTFPTQIGTFGVGARAFNAGSIDVSENYELLGRARAYQLALEGGGAIQMADWWLWGGTLFYSQETLGDDTRGTIGINSAMMFPDLFGRVTLGVGVRNWGTSVVFDELSFRPPTYGFAAASVDVLRRRNLIQTPLLFRGEPIVLDAKLAAQLDVPHMREPFPKAGIEATVNGVAIGRIGYQWGDDNNSGLSLGAGINVGQFRLEYAFRDRRNTGASFFQNDPVGDEHHVAATFFWGRPEANVPVAPVIISQPVDTAAINETVRRVIEEHMGRLRPLLDSLREQRVEIVRESDLVSQYIVPIHFDFDSAVVRDEDIPILTQVAEVIRQVYPRALVTIEGFADPAGSREYNIRLSQRRADAVKRVMVERFGLPERQFRAVGYGKQEERQVVPGAQKDDPGAERNRRVSFTIDATQRF